MNGLENNLWRLGFLIWWTTMRGGVQLTIFIFSWIQTRKHNRQASRRLTNNDAGSHTNMLTLKHLDSRPCRMGYIHTLPSCLVTYLQSRSSRNMWLKKSRHATAHEVHSIITNRASSRPRAEARSTTKLHFERMIKVRSGCVRRQSDAKELAAKPLEWIFVTTVFKRLHSGDVK